MCICMFIHMYVFVYAYVDVYVYVYLCVYVYVYVNLKCCYYNYSVKLLCVIVVSMCVIYGFCIFLIFQWPIVVYYICFSILYDILQYVCGT